MRVKMDKLLAIILQVHNKAMKIRTLIRCKTLIKTKVNRTKVSKA